MNLASLMAFDRDGWDFLYSRFECLQMQSTCCCKQHSKVKLCCVHRHYMCLQIQEAYDSVSLPKLELPTTNCSATSLRPAPEEGEMSQSSVRILPHLQVLILLLSQSGFIAACLFTIQAAESRLPHESHLTAFQWPMLSLSVLICSHCLCYLWGSLQLV